MKTRSLIIISIMFWCAAQATHAIAEDEMKLELSVIKGNKELPKVLYIMPWKRLPSDNLEQKLILHSLFDDVFEPIEPESFQQHIKNYQHYTQPQ